MRVLFAGGSTAGPVAPLLAVAESLRRRDPSAGFLLVSSSSGPGRRMARAAGVPFCAVAGGKLDRFVSLQNLAAPFLTLYGFFQALGAVARFKPDVALGAGGFSQVPVLWAARLLGVPVAIHQQDVSVSLSNRLCAPLASLVTCAFAETAAAIKNAEVIGNPCRLQLSPADQGDAKRSLGFSASKPLVAIVGGGTGAASLNRAAYGALPNLLKTTQVLHASGQGKEQPADGAGYRQVPFIDDMALAYRAADLVVCRAGLATITEISELSVAAILVPMPGTHQEKNAVLARQAGAALVISDAPLTPPALTDAVAAAIADAGALEALRRNAHTLMPHGASERLAELLFRIIKNRHA